VKTVPKLVVFTLLSLSCSARCCLSGRHVQLLAGMGFFWWWLPLWRRPRASTCRVRTPPRCSGGCAGGRQRSPHGAEGRHCRLVLFAAAMVVVSALDHRFGWSPVPTAVCLVGDVLVALDWVWWRW